MATGRGFSELYEPLSSPEVERAQRTEDSHGKVFAFRHRASGRDCAVRFLSIDKLVSSWKGSSEAAATAFMDKPVRRAYDIMARAVTVLDGLRHPNLLGLADPVLYLDPSAGSSDGVSPSDGGGDGEGLLLKVVTEAGDRIDGHEPLSSSLDVEAARELFVDLSKGLHCLHANLYLHRGIRLSSVARCRRGGALQLSSFCGPRSGSDDENDANDVRVAPEVRQGEAWTARADVWALGVLFYELLTGGALPAEDLAFADPVLDRCAVFDAEPGAWELIVWMLRTDPSRRPTVTQVMNHPWLSQAARAAQPPDFEGVGLAREREVSVLRLERCPSEAPLGLSMVVAELQDLTDPDAVLLVPSTTVKQGEQAKDAPARALLGAMLRQLGCDAAPTPGPCMPTPIINKSQGSSAGPPVDKACAAPTPSQPTVPPAATQACDQKAQRPPLPSPCPRGLWVVPDTDEVDEQAVWSLHRGLLSSIGQATAKDDTVLVVPLSLYTSRCRNVSRPFIAHELCNLVILLASCVPASRLKKVVVVAKDVEELKEMLGAFHALESGLCLGEAASTDLLALSREVRELFACPQLRLPEDFRADAEMRAYVDNLQLRPDALQTTATFLQVCLWCRLIARRLSQLVLHGGYPATEVFSSSAGGRCIAVLNHDKVDHYFESLHRNLGKASVGGSGRGLGLLTVYDALQSLRSLRGLLRVLQTATAEPGGRGEGWVADDALGQAGDEGEEEDDCGSLVLDIDPAMLVLEYEEDEGEEEGSEEDCTVVEGYFSGTYARSSPTTVCEGCGESVEGEDADLTNTEASSVEEGEGGPEVDDDDDEVEGEEDGIQSLATVEDGNGLWLEPCGATASWRDEPRWAATGLEATSTMRPRSWSGGHYWGDFLC